MPNEQRVNGAISIAHHQALAERDDARLDELRLLGKRSRDLRVQADVAESTLASRLYYFHEDGIGVDGLAAAAGLTREDALEAIDRYRAEGA
jgi:hypothetical protein